MAVRDVIVMLGQSNQEGEALVSGLPASLTGPQSNRWIWSLVPQRNEILNVDVGNNMSFPPAIITHGPELTLAEAAVAELGKVWIFKYAIDGTSLGPGSFFWWHPNALPLSSNLFDNFKTFFGQFVSFMEKRGDIVNVIFVNWFQGEADAIFEGLAESYYGALQHLKDKIRDFLLPYSLIDKTATAAANVWDFEWDAEVDGALHADLTFTRASTGNYLNDARTLASAASGVARFDNTGKRRGYLGEGQRTNVVTDPENISGAGWGTQGTPVITLNAKAAIDGTTTADLVQESAGASDACVQTQSLSASTAYTLSVRVENLSSGRTRHGFYDITVADWVAWIEVNWTGFVPSFSSSGGTALIDYGFIDLGNNIWIVWVSGTTAGANTYRIYCYPDRLAASGAIYVWGHDWETGEFPSTYKNGSRGASDTCTYALPAALATALGTEGTLFLEFSFRGGDSNRGGSDGRCLLELHDGTANERFRISNRSNQLGVRVVDGGVDQYAQSDGTTHVAGAVVRLALSWKAGAMRFAVNGTLQTAAGGTPTIPTVTTLDLLTNRSGSNEAYALLHKIAIKDSWVEDTVLQDLSGDGSLTKIHQAGVLMWVTNIIHRGINPPGFTYLIDRVKDVKSAQYRAGWSDPEYRIVRTEDFSHTGDNLHLDSAGAQACGTAVWNAYKLPYNNS